MKIAALVIGILLLVLSGIGFIVCLALPAMTENRVSFEEAMWGLIPSVIVFCFAFILTVVAAIFVFKGKKKSAPTVRQSK
jgi:uncharacterized Tic20 family protein